MFEGIIKDEGYDSTTQGSAIQKRRSGGSIMACKGICTRYKAIGPMSEGRYKNGYKRCNVCDLFITYEGLFCPCCGMRLRVKPRSKKYKEKLNDSQQKGNT